MTEHPIPLCAEIDRLRVRVKELEAENTRLRMLRDAAESRAQGLEAENKRLREVLYKCLMGGVFFASDLVDEVKQALGEASYENKPDEVVGAGASNQKLTQGKSTELKAGEGSHDDFKDKKEAR